MALLAQMLLSLLLFRHQCTITGVIRAHCCEQFGLLRQRLFLLFSLLFHHPQLFAQPQLLAAK
ncbi:Uncharacterised protein [Serratia rubidaea]|uniref:Uncharacterized protein n=1 Tax=Serratia rubidaea TaxID=61652 RepID=A0A4U9HGE7_SERRU|nr:Uncharacterised protein [Serratia rubidaea]